MKTFQEVQTRLKLELIHWMGRQCQDIYADFYLYYQTGTAEHDSGILIVKEQPKTDYQLVAKVDKGATIEQNFNKLSPMLFKLPVLDIRH